MEKVTKIVAILVFIVSIGFLFFAAKTIDRIGMQKNLIASLQENVSSLQNTINSLTETINLAKDEITSLRTFVEQLKQEVDKAIADKEKAEKALAEAQNKNKQLETKLQEANAKITMLTIQLEGQQQGGIDNIKLEGLSLEEMVAELTRRLKGTENELAATKDRIETLEALGILLEKAPAGPVVDGTPQIAKGIEGEIIEIEPNGIVAIKFKGSIKPQKGTIFYIADSSNEVKARLSLEEVYNTIMIANMDIEKQDYNIKNGDRVNLVVWTEE